MTYSRTSISGLHTSGYNRHKPLKNILNELKMDCVFAYVPQQFCWKINAFDIEVLDGDIQYACLKMVAALIKKKYASVINGKLVFF